MKLDILAIAAHPDDVELGCGGTVAKHVDQGKKVGVVDLTQGEMGTRGSAELRLKEAAKAADILGLEVRDNLGMADGFFENNRTNQVGIVKKIRQYRPEIVLTNALRDRHPDHGRASELVSRSCFLAGLKKLETEFNGEAQEPWRPKAVYHFLQDRYIEPDIVVDITDYFEQKMEAVMAFSSQFHNPKAQSNEPTTAISSPEFIEFLKGRAFEMGRRIKTRYGEAFNVERTPGVDDLLALK